MLSDLIVRGLKLSRVTRAHSTTDAHARKVEHTKEARSYCAKREPVAAADRENLGESIMGKVARIVYALIAGTSLLSAAARAAVVDEINAVEDQRYQAMVAVDRTALEKLLGDEFVYHQPSGKVATKTSYIEQFASGEVKVKSFERYGVTVHDYGDVATAMGSTRVEVEIKGEARKVDLAYLNVWAKRDGRWQLVSRQSAYKPGTAK